MSLSLSHEQIQKAKDCWNSVQANNKYHKDQFMSRLFSNLLAANSELRSFLKTDVIIREHTLFFNDLLNYVVIYLDSLERLDKFLSLFLKENEELVRNINYLEQMGTALIQTFRQWIGRGIFNDEVEGLWVKIYIYLANNVLVFSDDSDASSFNDSETESIEEIKGLNINRNEPINQLPMTPKSPSLEAVEEDVKEASEDEMTSSKLTDLTRKPSIQVDIKSNNKYKGFRRSDSQTFSIQSCLDEPKLPERSPRRAKPSVEVNNTAAPSTSLTAKFNNLQPKLVHDEPEEIEEEKGFGFDPRKLNKKRHGSVEPFEDFAQKELPRLPDSYDINEKPSELDTTLQPTDESSANEVDIDMENDNSSSIYHSDNSEPISHTHSLSLHSHFSDGTAATEPMSLQKMELRSVSSNEYPSLENTRVFSKTFNSRQTSISSVEPEFMAQKSTARDFSSQTDLSLQKSIQLSQKASLGFMRSSFILKKEVDTLGYNRPENVFVKPPTIPAAKSVPRLQSKGPITESSSEEEDESFDLLNTFMPITESSKARLKNLTASSCSNLSRPVPRSHPNLQKHSRSVSNLSNAKHNNYKPMDCTSCTQSIRQSNEEIGKVKSKKSFKDKLRSLFSASKADLSISGPISSPIQAAVSSSSGQQTSSSSRPSFSSGQYSNYNQVSRVSSHTTVSQTRSEAEDKFTQMKPKLKPNRRYSTADVRSINTTGSNESTSGFSFFNNKRSSTDSKYSSRGDRSKNKYQVTKTPYDVFAHNKLVFSN